MTTNPWIPLIEITGTFTRPEDLIELNAEQLVEKAAKAFDSAKNEMTYGQTINDLLANESQLSECHRSLASIGLWHFECGVELFQKALRNFERAKTHELSKESQKEVEAPLRECKKQLAAAAKQKDSARDLLNLIGKPEIVQKAEKAF